MLAGKPLSLAEVGIQSGGSLHMWSAVLGQQVMVYGLDILDACKQFQEPNVDITVGDQSDWKMWQGFFTKVNKGIDILIDDGAHQAHHMLTTLQAAFPQTHPGGYTAIEDISVCPQCKPCPMFEGFFKPTA